MKTQTRKANYFQHLMIDSYVKSYTYSKDDVAGIWNNVLNVALSPSIHCLHILYPLSIMFTLFTI